MASATQNVSGSKKKNKRKSKGKRQEVPLPAYLAPLGGGYMRRQVRLVNGVDKKTCLVANPTGTAEAVFTTLGFCEVFCDNNFSNNWTQYRFLKAVVYRLRPTKTGSDDVLEAVAPFQPDIGNARAVLQLPGCKMNVVTRDGQGYDASKYPLRLISCRPAYDEAGGNNQFVCGWLSTSAETTKWFLFVGTLTQLSTILVELTIEFRGYK